MGRTSIYLPDELEERVEEHTEKTGQSRSEFFQEAADEYLSDYTDVEVRLDELERRIDIIEQDISKTRIERLKDRIMPGDTVEDLDGSTYVKD